MLIVMHTQLRTGYLMQPKEIKWKIHENKTNAFHKAKLKIQRSS